MNTRANMKPRTRASLITTFTAHADEKAEDLFSEARVLFALTHRYKVIIREQARLIGFRYVDDSKINSPSTHSAANQIF